MRSKTREQVNHPQRSVLRRKLPVLATIVTLMASAFVAGAPTADALTPVQVISCRSDKPVDLNLSTVKTNPGWEVLQAAGPYASIAGSTAWTPAQYPAPNAAWGSGSGLAEWVLVSHARI